MELIGKSGQIQRVMRHKFTLIRDAIKRKETVPVLQRRVLFTGPPGTGKTELGEELSMLLAESQFEMEKINGSNVNIELMRRWKESSHFRPLYGPVGVKFVDEIDAITSAALNDIRTYLDELPPFRVFIACTNQPVEKLQEQLQSRFQVCAFAPIPAGEIAALLIAKYKLAPAIAESIAHKARGNVRAAEEDATLQCDMLAAQAAA